MSIKKWHLSVGVLSNIVQVKSYANSNNESGAAGPFRSMLNSKVYA